MDTNELTTAQARLANAQAALLELDHAERSKTVRSVEDCWRHIQRFGDAMLSVKIVGFNERNIWLNEIDSQLKLSKQFLEDPKV